MKWLSKQELFKSNEKFITHKTWRLFYVCNRSYYSQAMQALLTDPNQGMKSEMLKVDTTTTVAIHNIDEKKLVIKRYNIKGFWHGLKRSISTSRAVKCWRNAHNLLAHNVPTAKPIAMMERRIGPFRRQAYYIYEFLPGIIAEEIFVKESLLQSWLPCKVEQITRLIKTMLQAKMSHGDLKSTNFIFCGEEVFFIDLDAMKRHKYTWAFHRSKRKDINRFLQNWDHELELKQKFAEKFANF